MIPGLVTGALFGAAIVTLWSRTWPLPERPKEPRTPRSAFVRRLNTALSHIGFVRASALHVFFAGLVTGFVSWVLAFALTSAIVPSVAAGIAGACGPYSAVMALARKRRENLRDVWPEVIDLVHSAVRAGLSLPEALSQLGERGPEALQNPFQEFSRDYQATGDFGHCLDRLKARLSDPVADRIVEALRVTRDVGGTDLGTLLRTLSAFLRDDARVRSELEARQSWTINGAKLALVAPWVVLGLMVLRPEAAQAYDTPAGAALIAIGAVVSIVAYRVMLMLARLPQDERVLA